MEDRQSVPGGADGGRPDVAKMIVTVLVAVGGLFYVSLGGLSAPPAAVLIGMALYLVAVAEMVRRLRHGDPYALAVPVVVVVAWTVVLFLGMLLFGWTP